MKTRSDDTERGNAGEDDGRGGRGGSSSSSSSSGRDGRASNGEERARDIGAPLSGERLVAGMRLGEAQQAGPMVVVPIFPVGRDESGEVATGRYITLRQALRERSIEIFEASPGGSVPEVRVRNWGDVPVLILDGEELRGAMQNRVLSTPILVGAKASLVVPVACTEMGRWGYTSPLFSDSDVVAERHVRAAMRQSVDESLRMGRGVRADQGRVWEEVAGLHRRHGTTSHTAAMSDAYEARRLDLDEVIAAFPLREGQNGIVVLHGARVVGLDVVSRAPQYAEVHERLLRSYVFDALVSDGKPGDARLAEAFLERIAGLSGQAFKSVGLGEDVRFEGGGVVGSALVWEGEAVHAAFFDLRPDEDRDQSGRDTADPTAHEPRPAWEVSDARRQARRRRPDGFGPGAGHAGQQGEAGDARPDAGEEARRLAARLRVLPGFRIVRLDAPYGHMGATLADAVLNGGMRRHRAPVPPRHRLRWRHPEAATTTGFARLLATPSACRLLGWREDDQISRLRTLIRLLLYEGVETEQQLLRWLDAPKARTRLAEVVGAEEELYHYLRFLCGAHDMLAEPWARRLLAGFGLAAPSTASAPRLCSQAAHLLHVSPSTLEYSLWRYAAGRSQVSE